MAEQNLERFYDNPYLFNAKELDRETGLYYYGARYYNPKLSIWYGVDPLAEKMPSWSPYAYTFNNPVKFTDPTGMEPDDHWIINKAGKAILKDTKGTGVFIKNQGDKIYKEITEYDFSSKKDALHTIVDYYSSETLYVGTDKYPTTIINYSSQDEYKRFNNTKDNAPFAEVRGTTKEKRTFWTNKFEYRYHESSGMIIYLIKGKIRSNAKHKYNFINSIGHEDGHIKDNIRLDRALRYGFEPENIKLDPEPSAVNYQKLLPSWEKTTPEYKNFINMQKISQYIMKKNKIIIPLFYFLTMHSCSNNNRIYFKKDFYRAEDVKCISNGNYNISEFNFGATIKNRKLIDFHISLYINLDNLDKQEKEYFRKTNTIYLEHKNEIYELVFDENLDEFSKWTRFVNLEFKNTEKKQMLMKQLLASNDINSVFNNCNDFFNKSTFFIKNNGEKQIICVSKDIFTGLSIYNEIKPNENEINSCSF